MPPLSLLLVLLATVGASGHRVTTAKAVISHSPNPSEPWSSLDAYFEESTYPAPPKVTTTKVDDFCVVATKQVGVRAHKVERPSAGRVVAQSGNETIATNELLGMVSREPTPGERITFMAAGDPKGVPAFRAEVVTPERTALSYPPPQSPQELSVMLGQPLALSWTETPGTLIAELTDPRDDVHVTVRCAFPASKGSGLVPAPALRQLGPGRIVVLIQQRLVKQVRAGDFDVEVGFVNWLSSTTALLVSPG